MNETISLLTTRKSDRNYTDQPVSDADLDAVIRAGHQAPTSCNGQHVSVVVVKDAKKRARIAELCGGQPWVAKAPVFLAVIGDLNKLNRGVERAGHKQEVQNCLEGAIVTGMDCGIAVMAMAMAANSLGLGCVPIGGIRNRPGEMIELLGLPPLTYASVGLTLGHVNKPGLRRPRLALSTFCHEETYSDVGLDEAIAAYDEELLAFWQKNNRNDGESWSKSVAPRFDSNVRPLLRPVLAKQGMLFED